MNRMGKLVFAVLLVLVIIGALSAYLMWNKPRRDIAAEQGITVTAARLVQEYQANEAAANTTYLNKAVEVTGTVNEVGQNQEGKTTILLASDDAFTSVFCTMKDNVENITIGNTITVKGKCNGMLSDVRLSEAVVVLK